MFRLCESWFLLDYEEDRVRQGNAISVTIESIMCNTLWSLWCDVTWHDVMWCDVMWRDVTWRDETWRDVAWRDVMWLKIASGFPLHAWYYCNLRAKKLSQGWNTEVIRLRFTHKWACHKVLDTSNRGWNDCWQRTLQCNNQCNNIIFLLFQRPRMGLAVKHKNRMRPQIMPISFMHRKHWTGWAVDASNTVNWPVAFPPTKQANAISAQENCAHLSESSRIETRSLSDHTSYADGHTIKCEIHQVGIVPPSAEALRKWENDSDLIQFTDWWHYTAVTSRLSSKADIGTGNLYTSSLRILCDLSLYNTKADCASKGFCWCAVTRDFVRSRRIICGVSLHTLSKCQVRTNTFLLLSCQQCLNPKLSVYGFQPCYKVWNILCRSCSAFSLGI